MQSVLSKTVGLVSPRNFSARLVSTARWFSVAALFSVGLTLSPAAFASDCQKGLDPAYPLLLTPLTAPHGGTPGGSATVTGKVSPGATRVVVGLQDHHHGKLLQGSQAIPQKDGTFSVNLAVAPDTGKDRYHLYVEVWNDKTGKGAAYVYDKQVAMFKYAVSLADGKTKQPPVDSCISQSHFDVE